MESGLNFPDFSGFSLMPGFGLFNPVPFKFLGLGSALIVVFGLYVVYTLFNEILKGYSHDIASIGKKLKFYSWGFIVSFSAWWFLLDLPESVPYAVIVPLVKITWC
jgi:hypothetical protein